MGRKGIGKLSLFSIAHIVEVHSIKKGGKRHGFRMNVREIEKKIVNSEVDATYHPEPIPDDEIKINKQHGTKIILKGLRKKRLSKTQKALRKKIARRFSIIGEEYHFNVTINGEPVTIQDRDYFDKIQYLWYFGDESEKYISYCKHIKDNKQERRDNKIKLKSPDEPGKENIFKIKGWIGSVKYPGDLTDQEGEDNLNKIVIMVRGKLAQEDILEDFTEGRLFTKYIIGEIHVDFLDMDDEEDSATSNRQEIIKDDPRYEALKKWVDVQLKHIGNRWTDLRNAEGEIQARQIKSIDRWFDELEGDDKKYAKSLFGKINQLTIDSSEDRNVLFTHSVLAFENLKYKKKLSLIDKVSIQNWDLFTQTLANYDDIEATWYHQIIKGRLKVIEKFHEKVNENELERIIQKYLYDHLWLLDPSWDRATETPYMEQKVQTEFEKINANLTEEEKNGRVDLKYKNSSGKHIIIELKRAGRLLSTTDIIIQIEKYRDALRKCLKTIEKEREPIETIVLIGRNLKDCTDETKIEESRRMLVAKDTRVIMYQKLIDDAYRAYGAFLDKNKKAGKLNRLLDEIETEIFSLKSY
jgi:hypothetical protein